MLGPVNLPVIDNEFDRGELAAMFNSRAWQFFARAVEARIEQEKEALVARNDENARGTIVGMRELIHALPGRLLKAAEVEISKKGDRN